MRSRAAGGSRVSVFRRRRKLTIWQRVLRFIWPRMGFRRTGRYYAIRIKRLPGTPYSIACGFACGASVSFTPLIGFHFILAALVAWALRGNVIAAAIGTAVGNPWTFPFIWTGVYWLGTTMLGYERGQELPAELSIGVIFEEPQAILLPMLAGGAPAAIVVWVLFYIPIRRVIANYQHHKRVRRLKRRQVLAEARKAREAEAIANSNNPEQPQATANETTSETTAEPVADEAAEAETLATVTKLSQVVGDRGRR